MGDISGVGGGFWADALPAKDNPTANIAIKKVPLTRYLRRVGFASILDLLI
jgi:hypothetical protein